MTPFNPTLGIGKHQQIVESQSRMEAMEKELIHIMLLKV